MMMIVPKQSSQTDMQIVGGVLVTTTSRYKRNDQTRCTSRAVVTTDRQAVVSYHR